RQTKNLMDINIDALYNILKQNQGDVNDATVLKNKSVVVTSDPLVLIAEKTKEGHFAKDCKKVKVKDYNYYKTKMLLAKKDRDEQVLLAEEQDWMESKIFHDAIESASENFIENHIDFQKDYDKSEVDYNDSEEKEHLVDKLIRKLNKKIAKCLKRIENANQQNKDFENQNKDLQDKYDVLKNQATTFEMNNKELNEQLKVLIEKNDDLLAQTKVLKDQLQVKYVVIDTHVECQEKYAKLKAKRYEYMIRYSAYFNNDKQHMKQITDQEVLYNKMSVQLVELDKHNADLLAQTKVLKDQLQFKHVVIDTHVECHEKYAKLEEERYEYMIRYSALFDNDKQHRKQIADQEVLFDKMSVQLVELDKHVADLKNTILEKDFKISELEECVRNKDLEIENCLERLNDCENKLYKIGQTNQTVHMIMPYKDNLYNGRKGIGFE
nr:hypothetical protein [Tanacetum cinerariifolium]